MASKPPTKEMRQKCYTARDAFFECLDNTNDDLYKCKDIYEVYEKNCPKTWVKHFELRRLDSIKQGRMSGKT